jgi:hypothetical protein
VFVWFRACNIGFGRQVTNKMLSSVNFIDENINQFDKIQFSIILLNSIWLTYLGKAAIAIVSK